MTFEETIEKRIRERFVHYKGSVYTKRIVELVRTLLVMAWVSESNDVTVERMAGKIMVDLPLVVDLDTTRGWENRYYECKSSIPPFA